MTTELMMEKWNSSMQLTRAADYGIRVMIHLAAVGHGERVSLPAMGVATGAPASFLSKVLQSLTRARLITSRRGPTGGFEISARGRRASMRDVIEAIDGRMCLNVCLSERRSCSRKDWCPAHPVWVRAQEAMLEILGGAKISELAEGIRVESAPIQIKTGTNN